MGSEGAGGAAEAGAAAGRESEPWREPWLRAILRCPADRAELLDVELDDAGAVLPGLGCTDPGHAVAYPVRDGIPVLLVSDAVPFPAPGAPS